MFEDFQNNEWTKKGELNEFEDEYSFYSYSAEYWVEHALAHRHDEGFLKLVKVLFDPSKTGNFVCWSRYWIWNTTNFFNNIELVSNTETLHFAAALSFDDICEWLIKEKGRRSDLDKLSSIGTPLFCVRTIGLLDSPFPDSETLLLQLVYSQHLLNELLLFDLLPGHFCFIVLFTPETF